MPRNVSLAALQASLATETEKVFLVLLDITHPSLGQPIRLVNNTENITVAPNVYTAFPFYVRMPDDQEEREPVAELVVSNATRELIDEVRALQDTLGVVLRVVLADSPATVEWGPIEMQVRAVTYNAESVVFQLGMQAFAEEPFPYRSFTPGQFPGMFKR
jgi:hypothetical protein